MPNSVLSRRRSWIARVAVLAVLASMLVVPGVASAQVTIIDTSSSCPASTPSAGFTDLAGLDATTVRAIDCLVNFGISKGTSTTTFSPANPVTRWQMALFLTRQATAHSVPLGDGSDQGFTDIAALDAETQKAINQLKQLGVTQGTSATTYSPNDNVSRWQMALFLKRLAGGAGIALNATPPDAGFTDIAALSDDAKLAINQLAAAGVAAGTSSTTFSPNNDVLRWQMALFLTRVLAADSIPPPAGTGQVTVTPTTEATIPFNSARAYKAVFKDSAGAPYTGKVGVQVVVFEADNTPDYNNPAAAATAVIEQVDGNAVGAAEFNGFPGLDGEVTFIVRGGATAGDVIPVAWLDLDGDNGYESTGDNPPTEPFGLGGAMTVSSPPAEAPDGNYTGVVVKSVNNSANSFVADDGGTDRTFNYDSNDILLITGNLTDEAGFEAALSETDVVNVSNYDDADATVVTFNITTNNTATASLKVTDPASALAIDANNYAIKGTGEAGQIVTIYIDSTNDGLKSAGEVAVGSGTVAAGGAWQVTVPLTQNAANDFVATQASTVGGAANGTGVQVPIITEGPPAAAELQASQWYDDAAAANGLDVGDVVDLNFNETMAAPGNGDAVEFFDGDGTKVRLTCGSNATCAIDAATDTIRLTVTLFPEVLAVGGTAGTDNTSIQVDVLTGFVGTDGLAVTGPDRLITQAAGPAPAL